MLYRSISYSNTFYKKVRKKIAPGKSLLWTLLKIQLQQETADCRLHAEEAVETSHKNGSPRRTQASSAAVSLLLLCAIEGYVFFITE